MTLDALKKAAKDETISQLLTVKELMKNRTENYKIRLSAMESCDYIETVDGLEQYDDVSNRLDIVEESTSMIDQIITLLKMM